MLELRAISKYFGGFAALEDVSFEVRAGEIVALLGENGAGKSTSIHIISGSLAPTSGELIWNGASVHWPSAREASRAGIGVVHQHFRLVPAFSVAQNLALASPLGGAIFSSREWEEKAQQWARSLGWNVHPRRRIDELGVGEAQRVEILKALFASGDSESGAQLLLLDEPTANLAPSEVEELFEVLRDLREAGRAIVWVSHKLREVEALCDRAIVLRRGKVEAQVLVENTNAAQLGALMVGRTLDADASPSTSAASAAPQERGEVVLGFDKVFCGRLRDFSLQVRAGEIVGVAGVDGNGQREIAELLLDLTLPESGEIVLSGGRDSLAAIPPDRGDAGLIGAFDLAENLLLGPRARREFSVGARLDWKGARARARDLIARFDVRTPQVLGEAERARAEQLSGGNGQKWMVARALAFPHHAVLACEPTRGLDIGAAQSVRARIREAARDGAGVLLISSDLDEVLALSDRVVVLFDGRLLPDAIGITPDEPREKFGALMGGDVGEATPST